MEYNSQIAICEPNMSVQVAFRNLVPRLKEEKIRVSFIKPERFGGYLAEELSTKYDLLLIDMETVSEKILKSKYRLASKYWLIDSQKDIYQRAQYLKQGFMSYIEFPFYSEEVVFRVRNMIRLLKRKDWPKRDSHQFLADEQAIYQPKSTSIYRNSTTFFINKNTRYIYYKDKAIYLSPKEMKLFHYFILFRTGLIPAKNILKQIGIEFKGLKITTNHRNLICSYISRIKRKLQYLQFPCKIESLYGYGYYIDFKF